MDSKVLHIVSNGEAPPQEQAQSMKKRVFDRVADAEVSHLTVPAEEGLWQDFCPGVQIKLLHRVGGVQSYLLKLEPGAVLPSHSHPVDEECMVLQGVLHVGSQIEVHPGGYHLAHEGSLHAPVTTQTGALIFLRGAVPHVEQLLA
jgi:quercetin dioxygenase-like cupin family protein